MKNTHYPRLAELREDADRSQKEIAELLGITRQQYQLYESGTREIPTHLLKRVCLIYHVSADYLLELPEGLNWPR